MWINQKEKKIPKKLLFWFPLKLKSQRLFVSSKIDSYMKQHDQGHTSKERV